MAIRIDWDAIFTGIIAGCTLYQVLKKRKEEKFKKKYLKDIEAKKNYEIQDFRIICTKNKITRVGAQINGKLGVRVKFISKRNAYKHRFYLTNKMYAFFVRVGDGSTAKFYGHIGKDKGMIEALKKQFLIEWKKD